MSLCYLCSGLTFSNLYPPNFYRHADDLAALEASAAGCRLCRMLHGCINHDNQFAPAQQELHFEGAYHFWSVLPEARKAASVKLQIIPGKMYEDHPEMKGSSYVGIWIESLWTVACMILSVEEGTEACRSTLHYLITLSR